jgi:uncharacterized membrane protein YtjA (UPF0391 family)
MIYWTLACFLVALVSGGALKFGGVVGFTEFMARLLFSVFLVLFLTSLIFGGRRPTV